MSALDLVIYHADVFHQFFRKAEEVDYFIMEFVANRDAHRQATPEARSPMFDKMQFLFSAYLGAMVSCWEIAKLTIQLDNKIKGLPLRSGTVSEATLESSCDDFNNYFSVTGSAAFDWFKFLKLARNASAHDGTCASYGGSDEDFFYPGSIKRFALFKENFVAREEVPPCRSTTESILGMGIHLVPLFASKVKPFHMTREHKLAQASNRLALTPAASMLQPWQIEQMLNSYADIIPDARAVDVSKFVNKWKGFL